MLGTFSPQISFACLVSVQCPFACRVPCGVLVLPPPFSGDRIHRQQQRQQQQQSLSVSWTQSQIIANSQSPALQGCRSDLLARPLSSNWRRGEKGQHFAPPQRQGTDIRVILLEKENMYYVHIALLFSFPSFPKSQRERESRSFSGAFAPRQRKREILST